MRSIIDQFPRVQVANGTAKVTLAVRSSCAFGETDSQYILRAYCNPRFNVYLDRYMVRLLLPCLLKVKRFGRWSIMVEI